MPTLYCEVDGTQDTVISDMKRIIKLRVKSSGPRSPPRIVIVGAPGSGKTTLSKMIAKKFSLIHVSVANLLNNEIAKKTSLGELAGDAMNKGELVPDNEVTDLVISRLNEPDCKVNGWILESYPKTEAQLNSLMQLKQNPSLVVIFQLADNLVYERHEYKKVDPITGQTYNLKESFDKKLLPRLVTNENDRFEVVKKRLSTWKAFYPKLEETIKKHKLSLNGSKTIKSLAQSIYEAIENPID